MNFPIAPFVNQPVHLVFERGELALAYFVQHWRGNHSLGRSLGINALLLAPAFFLLSLLVSAQVELFDASLRVTSIFAIATFVVLAGCWLWATVGVWRATAYSRSGAAWRRHLTRLLVILSGVALAAYGAFAAIPQVRELTQLATGVDPSGRPAEIARSDDGTTIVVSGALNSGSARNFAAILERSPTARIVVLDSPGGRIGEGAEIAKIVRERHLDTYVERRCESACTWILLAGHDRAITTNAEIGFHAPSFTGGTGLAQREAASRMHDFLISSGVTADFAAKASAVPNGTMWYPTYAELERGRVATRRSLGGEAKVISAQYATREDLERELLKSGFWRRLRTAYPDIVDAAVTAGWTERERGQNDRTVAAAMRGALSKNLGPIFNGTDDTTVSLLTDVVADELDAAANLGPQACAAFLDGTLNAAASLPRSMLVREITIIDRAASSRAVGPKYNKSQVDGFIWQLIKTLKAPEARVYIFPDNSYSDNLRCAAEQSFYSKLKSLPLDKRAAIQRALLLQ